MKKLFTWGLFALFAFNVLQAQTSYNNDFSGGVPPGIGGASSYNCTADNQTLKVAVQKNTPWESFSISLPQTINVSSSPYVNVKLRADRPCIIHVYLVDAANNNDIREVRVLPSNDNFTTFLFDFTGTTIDLTQITTMYIAANGSANSFSGTFWMDDLMVGTGTQRLANIEALSKSVFFMNSGSHSLLLSGITNASGVDYSNATLIDNVQFSTIINGYCTMTFDLVADQFGTNDIVITTIPNNGYDAGSVTLNLEVERNIAPVFNPIPDYNCKVGQKYAIMVDGIDDGNSTVEQEVAITAVPVDASVTGAITIESRNKTTSMIEVTPVMAGETQITVTATEIGTLNTTFSRTFTLKATPEFNNDPVIPDFDNVVMFTTESYLEVPITNFSDGDNGSQQITFTALSSNTDVVTVSIVYILGNPFTPAIKLVNIGKGNATISLTATDNGGNADNNGNAQTIKSFSIQVIDAPFTGFTIPINDFEADTTAKIYSIEGNNSAQEIERVTFDGSECLKITCISKGTWTGLWYRNPGLDLSENPYMSYEVYSVANDIQTHTYFWDNLGKRNADGAHAQRKTARANTWTTVYLDYRNDPALIMDDENNPINLKRIDSLLFNYHPSFGWPFTNYAGTLYIRNIRVGSDVDDMPALTPKVDFDGVADQSVFTNSPARELTITNITDGNGMAVTPTIAITNNTRPTLFSAIVVGSVDNSGNATLSFTPAGTTGSATITLTATASGSTPLAKTFIITVIDNTETGLVNVSVDFSNTGQTIEGMGASYPGSFANYTNFINEMGGNFTRLFWEGDWIEPVNDNADANVLDVSKFNLQGVDIDNIKKLIDAGITRFFVTILTPPSWMKKNLSQVYQQSDATPWENTSNRVEVEYYDEYAEFMEGICEAFKNETGIELMGICPQNEPLFSQAFGSAVLPAPKEAIVCAKLGKRLEQRGLKTEVIFAEMPTGWGWCDQYIDEFNKPENAEADKYSPIFGLHYPSSSVFPGFATKCNAGTHKQRMWGTECRAEGNDWSKAISNIESLMTGLNYGLTAWYALGFEGAAVKSNDYNPVGDGVALVYGTAPTKHLYALASIYKFVRPGMVWVSATSSSNNVLVNCFKDEVKKNAKHGVAQQLNIKC